VQKGNTASTTFGLGNISPGRPKYRERPICWAIQIQIRIKSDGGLAGGIYGFGEPRKKAENAALGSKLLEGLPPWFNGVNAIVQGAG